MFIVHDQYDTTFHVFHSDAMHDTVQVVSYEKTELHMILKN